MKKRSAEGLPEGGGQEGFADIAQWLCQRGLENTPIDSLLRGLCERICAAGVKLMRTHITMRAYHPEVGSIAFRWHRDGGTAREEFGYSDSPTEQWRQSSFYYLLENEIAELRIALGPDAAPSRFPFLNELSAQGATDYLAVKMIFGPPPDSLAVDPVNPPEGMLVSFTCDGPGGFSDRDIDGLHSILPTLSLALLSGSNHMMARDLLATYLGRDAGERVLSGAIQRGSTETMSAVILYFDLRGFTKLSEALQGDRIIAMLNDYFGSVVKIVEDHGGNVLKFMGDGMLSIFDLAGPGDARLNAVTAVTEIRDEVAAINVRRAADALPVTEAALALHAGDVLYGNIGGASRLDFTVIGPAVNTTARILGMSGPLDQAIVISSNVATSILDKRPDLVSLGQYRLRGVADRQELFTLDQPITEKAAPRGPP